LDEFAKENNLSRDIYGRMRRYFEYSYTTNANATITQYQKSVLLHEMPPQLKTECIMYIHRRIIDTIPFFGKKDVRFVAEV
jgi:hypothetical protein